MVEVQLAFDQSQEIVRLTATLTGVLTAMNRQNLLELAGLREFVSRLDFGSNVQSLSIQLIRTLQEYGTLRQTNQPALVSLLRELHNIVGGYEDEAELLATYDKKASTVQDRKRLNVTVNSLAGSAASDLQRVIDLLNADRFNEALPILEKLNAEKYCSRVVSTMFAEVRQELQAAAKCSMCYHAAYQDNDEIALLAHTMHTVEQARKKRAQFTKDYANRQATFGTDANGLVNKFKAPPKPRFTLPLESSEEYYPTF